MINQAFQIARVWGIPVRLHWTFLLLFVAIGLLASGREDATPYFLWSSLMVLVVFFCVVLHEFGHALTARRFGVNTVDIILSPIGGIARLDRLPPKPIEEFLVAIAGPMVNVGIAGVIYLVILLAGIDLVEGLMLLVNTDEGASGGFSFSSSFLPAILFLNLTLAAFNMIPAFPMDGGRIFRALLAMRLGRLKATRVAALVGQILAVGMVLFGLWQLSFITALIGGFIFITAMREYQYVRVDELLKAVQVEALYQPLSRASILSDTPLAQAADRLRRNLNHHFLVFSAEGQLQAALVESAILAAIKDEALDQPVAAYSHAVGQPLRLTDSASIAWQQMQEPGHAILPVIDDSGTLLGAIDAHTVQNYLQTGKLLVS